MSEPNALQDEVEENTLEEACAIMAGSTMRLPTVAHLLALREAHECDLIKVQHLLRELQVKFLQ